MEIGEKIQNTMSSPTPETQQLAFLNCTTGPSLAMIAHAFILYSHSSPTGVLEQHGAPGAKRRSYRNSVRARVTLSSIQPNFHPTHARGPILKGTNAWSARLTLSSVTPIAGSTNHRSGQKLLGKPRYCGFRCMVYSDVPTMVPSGMCCPPTVSPPASTFRGDASGTAGTSRMVSLMQACRNLQSFVWAACWISSALVKVVRTSVVARAKVSGLWRR